MIVLGYAVAKYLKTQHMSVTDDRSGFKMRLWPSGLKSQPTLVLLGVSATATFLNLVLCTASFSSTVRHVTKVGNIATVIVSTIAIILWLTAGILYKVDDLNELEHYDMLSYMRYAWWAVIVVGVLELTALGTVVWAICTPKKRVRPVMDGMEEDIKDSLLTPKGWSDTNRSDVEWGTQVGEVCNERYSIFLLSYLSLRIFSTRRITQATRRDTNEYESSVFAVYFTRYLSTSANSYFFDNGRSG
ncbi:hypothetical protein M431DRAFT_487773 [Trichoderma harzianum CBS 226.95]|uniref:Uncharacterized protein n=1 Tax=Trichoderma harzianum CBS 226.95 TaxID=983964 RepID=A0A2T3ZU45_TRIHA|nr:hypothetical protein M431DRAFT_487773 [Trichoderma harzianum CBS 226.95]PTB48330.1 hypothetical protein M431DRAFT_487773 [Trichoderma harzianum CBS 226.95]